MTVPAAKQLRRLLPALLLGAAVAVLASCGSSGKGLIPAANAGPLQSDFEAVAGAAQAGDGDCAATEAALGKTEQDFLALPATVNKTLRSYLERGIHNLHDRALAECAQPTSSGTATTQTQTTTAQKTTTTPPPATTTTGTETTPTATTPLTTPTNTTTSTSPSPPGQSGGTEAHGESEGEAGSGQGKGQGGESSGKGESSGGAGGASGGASPGGER